MKTVLIVEDEKMIRQGIKTMIQRSGVPIDMIMECSNGLMAMDILKNQKIDVMFTDIRMPKMDGIELVKSMQELQYKPFTIVISGYDDFSYAVEMLRMGVKEYILKPIDREKIKEVLEKMEEEIQKRDKSLQRNLSMEMQQIRYIISSERLTEQEQENLNSEYFENFFPKEYVVCCSNFTKNRIQRDRRYIYFEDIDYEEVFIADKELIPELQKSEFVDHFVGISTSYSGFKSLREAYIEAKEARKKAFWQNRNVVLYEDICLDQNVDGKPDIGSDQIVPLVQLLGTDKYEDAVSGLEKMFKEAVGGINTPMQMQQAISIFIEQMQKVYQNVVKTEEDMVERLSHIYIFGCEAEYEKEFFEWLSKFCQTMNSQFDDYKNKQKIQQAIVFIQENFDKDLNMAVVSNHISMNYSLFSYVFKQYTGSNFVNYLKDIRIKEAKRLLEETEMRVVEISQSVGYENEKHFMKTFKSVCGVSPTEYRKNMQYKN